MVIIVAILAGVLVLAVASIAAKRIPGYRLANPFVLPTAFIVLCLLDFAYLGFDRAPVVWMRPLSGTGEDFAWAALVFGLHTVALYIGALIGLTVKPKGTRPKMTARQWDADARNAARLALVFALIAAALLYLETGFSISMAELSASKAQLSEANPFLPIFTWMAVISFGLWIATTRASVRKIAAFTVCAMALVTLLGVRIHLLTLAAFFLAALAWRGKGPGVAALPILVAGGIAGLTFLRFIRASAGGHIDTFADFLDYQGGPFKAVFGSLEMASAEITVLLLRWQDAAILQRTPGEGLLGLATLMVPRAWFDWKPVPASTEFTQHLWHTSVSDPTTQIVMGSGMELTLEMGIVGATAGMAAAGFSYGILARRFAALSPRPHFSFVVMSLCAIVFLRNDIANIGVLAWPLAFVLLIHTALGRPSSPSVARLRAKVS